MALSVPLSRFTPRVGGGSAFFVRPPIHKIMQHPQDIVWDTITESAKTRFDYSEFERVFSDTGSPHLADNVLFLVVAGLGAENSPDEIIGDINRELALLGVLFPGATLGRFIIEKMADRSDESKENQMIAACMAAKGYELVKDTNAPPPAVTGNWKHFR